MALEYVKHNRTVTAHDLNKYGRLADHDLLVPCLLIYEMGEISDKNGTPVDLNKEFIQETMQRTNDFIVKRAALPFARTNPEWNKSLDEINAIPLIKNHKTDEVENQVGYSRGLSYTEEKEGILSLYIDVEIRRIEAKQEVEGGLLRAISIGTRGDGSVKEISFVSNEAAPLCGLQFSEPGFVSKIIGKKRTMQLHLPDSGLQFSNDDSVEELTQEIPTKTKPIKKTKEIKLAEQIDGLELAEHELEEVVIPNHFILSRMIKSGKIYPFKYDELIKTRNLSALELMESSIPSRDIGKMHGTSKQAEYVPQEALQEKQFAESMAKSQEKLKIKKQPESQDTPTPKMLELIRQNVSFEEVREKELKHILELAEHSPEIAAKYIKCELGEEVENPKYKDVLLAEYLNELKSIKKKLKTLTLQFEETK